MENNSSEIIKSYGMTRRNFLRVTSMSAAGFLIGCAVNPVTGEKQFMLMSEAQEVQIDKENSPHQFSSDYGILQDRALNNYIAGLGKNLAAKTQRPDMPYSFQGVNATYINAYAFPGGSIAITRGILLKLDNEAELAGLLGHELGHVNARHTAQQMSKSTVTNIGIAILTAYVGTKYSQYAGLAGQLGMLGAGALLASYSRSNERQADALGNDYMVQAGYNTQGFVGLMEMLNSLSKHKSAGITDTLFATHPMSDERHKTALQNAQTTYKATLKSPLGTERYMDNTSRLRAIRGAIEGMQKGETLMAGKKYGEAESHFRKALKQAPGDYAGLLLMSKCLLAQNKNAEAQRYAEQAKQVNGREAQAYHVSGFAKTRRKRFSAAFQDFRRYEQLLPGNPNTTYFKGLALDGMGRRKEAAGEYSRYLQSVQQGPQAKQAYQRMVQWGFIKK
ncbi:MAG TPA: tetratricopeptide repeat protein [Desulfobacterales bacterium]|nr:tetratricopeptide repeat protein [Desulfobacterales bacterium]